MPLSWVARARAAVGRQVARAIVKSPTLRARFVAKRAAPVDGCVVDPELAAVLGLDDLDGTSDLRRHAPPAARDRVAESVLVCDGPPLPGVATRDLSFAGPAGALGARLYTPEGLAAPSPGIVYIHGGGFVTCDLDTHHRFCQRLALGGRLRVVSLEYRLAPEHPFPAAVDDALAGFRWVAASAAELGLDPARLALAGDSAGGNLGAVVARRARGDAAPPALHALIYPALDATCDHPSHALFAEGWFLTGPMIDWYYGHYLGADPARRRDPDASPLLAPDLAGLSPALVYVAHFDPLRDEGRAYVTRLRAAGVPAELRSFDSLTHGFTLMTGLCEAARAGADRIAAEIGEALRRGGLA